MKLIVAVLVCLLPSALFSQAKVFPPRESGPDAPTTAQETPKGPFGFYYGETREQVIAAVGKSAVASEEGTVLVVTSAPKPYPGVRAYSLAITPAQGLVIIVARSEEIQANEAGSQVRAKFSEIEEGLTSVYGAPSSKYDFLHASSLWTEDRYWMQALSQGERSLSSFWRGDKRPLPNHLALVQVTTSAENASHGHLDIGYFFEGYESYLHGLKERQNGVL